LIVAAFSGLAFTAHKYPKFYQKHLMGVVSSVASVTAMVVVLHDFGVEAGRRAVQSLIPPDKYRAVQDALDAAEPAGMGTVLLVLVGLLLYLYVLLWLSVHWEHERATQRGTQAGEKEEELDEG
jgi:hypothetical protein